jgi:hypothetical protein
MTLPAQDSGAILTEGWCGWTLLGSGLAGGAKGLADRGVASCNVTVLGSMAGDDGDAIAGPCSASLDDGVTARGVIKECP